MTNLHRKTFETIWRLYCIKDPIYNKQSLGVIHKKNKKGTKTTIREPQNTRHASIPQEETHFSGNDIRA